MDTKPSAQQDTKVLIGVVRFSYCHLFSPDSINGGDPKYSVSLIIPKSNTKLVETVKQAIRNAYDYGLRAKWNGKATGWKNPLRDGDEDRPDDEAYKDAYFINASSNRKPEVVKPGTVNGKRTVVAITDEEEVYSGCFGYASVNFYPFAASGNKGVAAGLNNVLKTKDGDYLGGRVSAESEFGELAGGLEEEDGDLPEDIF